jgi:hypothetical protein
MAYNKMDPKYFHFYALMMDLADEAIVFIAISDAPAKLQEKLNERIEFLIQTARKLHDDLQNFGVDVMKPQRKTKLLFERMLSIYILSQNLSGSRKWVTKKKSRLRNSYSAFDKAQVLTVDSLVELDLEARITCLLDFLYAVLDKPKLFTEAGEPIMANTHTARGCWEMLEFIDIPMPSFESYTELSQQNTLNLVNLN